MQLQHYPFHIFQVLGLITPYMLPMNMVLRTKEASHLLLDDHFRLQEDLVVTGIQQLNTLTNSPHHQTLVRTRILEPGGNLSPLKTKIMNIVLPIHPYYLYRPLRPTRLP